MPVLVYCDYCKVKKIKIKPSKSKKQKHFFCCEQHFYLFLKGKPTWNKGLKGVQKNRTKGLTWEEAYGKETAKRMRETSSVTWFRKGYKPTDEVTEKRKQTIKETQCLSGKRNGMYGRTKEKNPNWQGGISYWRKEYYNSIPYKNWQKSIFKRDNYLCQICRNKCRNKDNPLHAHHIKSFALYPTLRLNLDNGITLCKKCHCFVHSNKFKKQMSSLKVVNS